MIYDNESFIIGDEIILQPQNPGEEKTYNIIIKNLKNIGIGEYQLFLWFYADGEKFGDKLTVTIIIKQKNEDKLEKIEENIEKIREFRENFNLTNEEYSDEKILEILTKNNFDMELSFKQLLD